ncbi:MAG TPA: CHASE3 domain-containing protein [Methylophilaceae bacterium]|nr:CHASE3 domain-containing protein [Methylotenera sp.]HSH73377.1 CHASE3 domain-containing protein [Methylophilaceae bacterium]
MKLIFKVLLWWSKTIDKLGGRVVASLIAAMILTLVAVAFTDSWIVAIGKEDAKLKVLNENARVIATLKASLFHAESAQRGFLVTERQEYLGPFNQALAEARASIKTLKENFSDEVISEVIKEESDLLQNIAASVEAKSTEMVMTIQLAKTGNIKDAIKIINLDQGLIEASKFTEQTQHLTNLQLQLLGEIRDRRNTYASLSRVSLIGSALALSFLVMVVIRQLTNEIANRDRLSRALAEERLTLEASLKQRTDLLETLAVDYQYDVERERRKLARELHDELGSILTATKMDISWVVRTLKETAPQITEKLQKTSRYIDQGIQFKRRIVEELHPSMLSTFGFWPSMKELVESAAERNQWELDLILPDESTQLSEALGLIAYRLVQESLNNATKYSKASKVSVSIMVDLKYLKLEIEDNGVGMDMAAVSGETHGLTGMRHRVQAIGGNLEIISQPGDGVFTRAMIPLDTKINPGQAVI